MADGASTAPEILFTAFEPSGDDHASSVIAELKLRHPDLSIHAWGGPRMAAAGADLIERTGDDAVMGMPGFQKIREHQRINARIASWMDQHRPALHVPVDSPAANFPVCRAAKERGIKVVHLVAPQIWAWGAWRISKLRRLTDHVLCLLPFEEEWFRRRGVSAEFIGHPLFDDIPDAETLHAATAGWPDGKPRIALMPGSRPSEIHKNFPLLVEAYRRLEREHEAVVGMVAATRPELEPELRRLATRDGKPWPGSLHVAVRQTDAVIRWCDLAIVVSGTVTMQIARQHKPMVIVYKAGRLMWSLLARWLIQTKRFTLPNLIAGRDIVPELVPHFGGAEPIADAAVQLLEDTEAAERQRRDLAELCTRFVGRNASVAGADAIERILGLASPVGAAATAERE